MKWGYDVAAVGLAIWSVWEYTHDQYTPAIYFVLLALFALKAREP